MPDPQGSGDNDSGRYSVTLSALEKSTHVAEADLVVEVPARELARAPGDDELSRQQRAALTAGG